MANFNHFPQLAKNLPKVAGQLVRKAAFDVQGRAAGYAAVKSGFMKSSIYVVTSENAGGDSSYGQGVSGSGTLLPALPAPDAPNGGASALIGVAADYGVYQELGTRHMPAHPFMTPAAEDVRPSFEQSFARLEDALKA